MRAGRSLPALNALRAVEAAARHRSFTRAADELHVTQTAISHHVRQLEERLGLRLFRRLNNALVLTARGEAYPPLLQPAFDLIAEATELARGERLRILSMAAARARAALLVHDVSSLRSTPRRAYPHAG